MVARLAKSGPWRNEIGMEIYVLRHGEAEPRGPGIKEALRALTAKGKRDVKSVLDLAAGAMDPPGVILTSPLLRAKQTAAIAVKAFPAAALTETASLLPAAGPEVLWQEIGRLRGIESVLVAGHEPHLSNFVRYLLATAIAIDLKKGSLVRIATQNHGSAPRGSLKWMLTPRLVRGK